MTIRLPFLSPTISNASIVLNSELPAINSTISIQGSDNLVISGNNNSRIFSVETYGVLSLYGTTITEGYLSNNVDGGAAVSVHGGVLEIIGSRISNNTVVDGVGGAIFIENGLVDVKESIFSENSTSIDYNPGGAIYVRYGNLDIYNSEFSGNSTDGRHSNGGAIFFNGGDLNIANSRFSENSTNEVFSKGGAVFFKGENLNIKSSRFSENLANEFQGDGSAIYGISAGLISIDTSAFYNNNSEGDGGAVSFAESTVIISNSVFFDNYASAMGGAIGLNDDTTATITNSTLYNNHGLAGGAIYLSGSSTTTVTNSTIVGNRTTLRNFVGSFRDGGGISSSSSSTTNIRNSIVSGNRARSFLSKVHELGLYGPYTLINNVLGSATFDTASSFNNAIPNRTNILSTSDQLNLERDQIVSLLADNGGLTLTHALPGTSPAFNAGNNVVCPDYDQRGEPRDDGHCDIGAFEGYLDEETFFVVPMSDGNTVIFSL